MTHANNVRPTHIIVDVNSHALGSVLYCSGKTKVLATMSMQDNVPKFMKDMPGGWLTAEYSMLPASTTTRNERDYKRPHANGRVMEIQRLIGRALRSCIDLKKLPPRKTITIDCDILQADGSTRTTSVNAGMIALMKGIHHLQHEKILHDDPVIQLVAAVSVGMYKGDIYVDLDYEIDSQADCDINVVMNEHGHLIEIQGAAEKSPIMKKDLDRMLDVAFETLGGVFTTIKTSAGLLPDIL